MFERVTDEVDDVRCAGCQHSRTDAASTSRNAHTLVTPAAPMRLARLPPGAAAGLPLPWDALTGVLERLSLEKILSARICGRFFSRSSNVSRALTGAQRVLTLLDHRIEISGLLVVRHDPRFCLLGLCWVIRSVAILQADLRDRRAAARC